jgi:8-oxo-dGTP pyrophosphatase MutT (NUDIX family)
MLLQQLSIEVDAQCISVWKKQQSKRSARVTLLVDFDDRFAVVTDPRSGLWFLPGGGVEQNESVEDAAKREAVEELGLDVNVNRVIATFNVTLIAKDTREHLKIPPFIVVLALPVGGQLTKKYASNRKILLVRKGESNTLPENLKIPAEYEWMKPYLCVSREVVREFVR